MKRPLRSAFAVASFAVFSFACAHSSQTPSAGVTSTTSGVEGTVLPNESAIEQIATKRCAQLAACPNRAAAPVTNGEDCMNATRMSARTELGAAACPSGIDSNQLDRCLAAMDALPCSSRNVASLSQLDACSSSTVCVSQR